VDSKVINKLIRSEVWPILREQGFSHFDSRNAIAYRGPFVNVVNFQSYSSQLAAGLGCTTYSFGLNLGVYVLGSPWEEQLKHDKNGLVRPPEYGCSLRTSLRKRTTVDGFKRDDIFYIHPDGRTTANCFQEVKYLLTEVAPKWFSKHNDLDGMLAGMRGVAEAERAKEISTPANRGSYSWNLLHALLLLIKHRQFPSEGSAEAAVDAIGQAVGNVLGFSTVVADRPGEEGYARDIAWLWEKLGAFKPIPPHDKRSMSLSSCLDGPLWSPATTFPRDPNAPLEVPMVVSARKQFWPMLKAAGFTEFTDRLAHRVSKHCVEVVEVLPMDRFERKSWNLPEGLFRVGVGVFWPTLRQDGLFRTNRNGDSRPTVNHCHVSNWLGPELLTHRRAGTAFRLVEDASTAIAGTGLGWLQTISDADSALMLLERKDWELFWCYPMMRGYGASASCRRLIYIAFLKRLTGQNHESEEYVFRAEADMSTWYSERWKERHVEWIEQVKERLLRL
jgi:hypothetical protein